MILKLRLCQTLTLLLVIFSSAHAYEESVYYAGISYIGDHSKAKNNFPFSSEIIDQKLSSGQLYLEPILLKKLRTVDRKDGLKIILDENSETTDALTMSFALEYESVTSEKIGDYYKTLIDIRANILIFDFSELMLISSYPVSIQLRDVSELKPSKSVLSEMVRALYTSNKYKINIFDEFVKRLSTIPIKRGFNNSIKVKKIIIEEKAKKIFPDINVSDPKQYLESLIAHSFSSSLSKNQNVPVLPYIEGEAVGRKMRLKIADGEAFNLEIPEETFSVIIYLRGFKQKILTENSIKSVKGYASYHRIVLKINVPGEEDSDDDIKADTKYVKVLRKTILKNENHTVDDWALYQESIQIFLDEFTKNISNLNEGWIEETAMVKTAKKDLVTFNQKIELCR